MALEGLDLVFFYLLGAWTLAAGALTVAVRNPVHSALALVSALVSTAGLFVLLRAEFLAGAQILVYVGGVMVLFLFVIMLVDVGREGAPGSRVFTRLALPAALAVALLAGAFTLAAAAAAPLFAPLEPREQAARVLAVDRAGARVSGNTGRVGADLYTRAALPFEIASVLLLVAIVGSVLLARGRKQERIFD